MCRTVSPTTNQTLPWHHTHQRHTDDDATTAPTQSERYQPHNPKRSAVLTWLHLAACTAQQQQHLAAQQQQHLAARTTDTTTTAQFPPTTNTSYSHQTAVTHIPQHSMKPPCGSQAGLFCKLTHYAPISSNTANTYNSGQPPGSTAQHAACLTHSSCRQTDRQQTTVLIAVVEADRITGHTPCVCCALTHKS